MNKGRFIKTVAATLCLTSMMSIVAFADPVSKRMGDYGNAYLTQNRVGGLGSGTAITRPIDIEEGEDDRRISNYQTLTVIKAYYDDGDVGGKQDGPCYRTTKAEYDYGYIESFTSVHKIIYDAMLRSYVELP